MSKKIAVGAHVIVLDVKVGRGAFMKTLVDGYALAEALVGIAAGNGRRARAILSAMNQPLGGAVGGSLEIAQALEVLGGGGPADLRELALLLASEALLLSGKAGDLPAARRLLEQALLSGAALAKLAQMVEAQGGDGRVVANPSSLPRASTVRPVSAARTGFVRRLDARAVGKAVLALGGGRRRKGDLVDPAVGVLLLAKEGDPVARGQPLAHIHAQGTRGLAEAEAWMNAAYRVGPAGPPVPRLILGCVG